MCAATASWESVLQNNPRHNLIRPKKAGPGLPPESTGDLRTGSSLGLHPEHPEPCLEQQLKAELKAGMGKERVGKEKDSNGEGGNRGREREKKGEMNGT